MQAEEEREARERKRQATVPVPSLRKSDSEFARELQETENKLMVKANPKKVSCLVCIEDFSIENQFLGERCYHENDQMAMCMPCAIDYIKSEVNSSHFPIKCFVAKCDAEFTNSDLGEIFYVPPFF